MRFQPAREMRQAEEEEQDRGGPEALHGEL